MNEKHYGCPLVLIIYGWSCSSVLSVFHERKSEASTIFRTFHAMIRTQFSTNIQILRTDRARYFFNFVLGDYLITQGIVHQSSCMDTPQHNGVAKRKKCHLLEVAHFHLFTRNVPRHFWGDAVRTTTYLINRMSSRVLSFQTPIQTRVRFTTIPTSSTTFHCTYLVAPHSCLFIPNIGANLILVLSNVYFVGYHLIINDTTQVLFL